MSVACAVCGLPWVAGHVCVCPPAISVSPVAVTLNDHEARLTALEQQSRAYAEDGALAAGRGAGDEDHVPGCKQPWKGYPACRCIEILTEREHELVCQREDLRQALLEEIAKADTARAALRKIADECHSKDGRDFVLYRVHQIATDALAGGEANEGSES